MKKLGIAFALSYIVTLVTMLTLYVITNGDDLKGTAILTQQIRLLDSDALSRLEATNGLPFSWLELSASKAARTKLRQQFGDLPLYQLRQEDDRLLLEVWESAYFKSGADLTEWVKSAFPMIRDTLVAELEVRGIAAEPVGEIRVQDDQSRYWRGIAFEIPLYSFLFVPAFLVTVIVLKPGRSPNQALQTTRVTDISV